MVLSELSLGVISFYGSNWCGDCRRAKKFLQENGIEFDFIDIGKDKTGEQFVLKVNNGLRSIPTIVFEDGSILVEPSNHELSLKLHYDSQSD
jgi:mycoredoxin